MSALDNSPPAHGRLKRGTEFSHGVERGFATMMTVWMVRGVGDSSPVPRALLQRNAFSVKVVQQGRPVVEALDCHGWLELKWRLVNNRWGRDVVAVGDVLRAAGKAMGPCRAR